MERPSRWLVLPLLAAGWACGKSDTENFADSYCAEVAKCCGQAGLPADGQTCRQWMAFAAAGGSYNAAAGDACLAEMRAEVGAGTFCTDFGSPSSSSSPSACDSVYGSPSGNRQPGETCDFDSDCAPSSEGKVACASLYVNGAFIDKCQVQMPGQAGDTPCVGTRDGIVTTYNPPSGVTDVVPRGYICNVADGITCASGTCTALAAAGATCTFSSDCVRTAFCDYHQDTCVPRIAAGAACTGSDSSECVDGYYCPTTTAQQCIAKLANGTACTTSDMCQSDYCSNGTCQNGGLDTFGLSLLCGG
jgi:hypothetical protein